MKDEEKDSFWDLSALLPRRRQDTPLRSFARRVETSDVTAEKKEGERENYGQQSQLTMLADESGSEQAQEYCPAGNNLMLKVRILRRQSAYNFYGQFRRDAIRYLKEEGHPCPAVSFFSYIPQYAQLSEAQRAFYFYWRSCVRRGEYPGCDESYFYLYVYEIINLPDYIPPEDGILQLCAVWKAYRARFPRIDKYMVEWVCDYCLVHGLSCPSEEVRPFLRDILPLASLREFYLGALGDLTPDGVQTALAFFCDYRWQDSRYATGEYAALFAKHIPGSVTPVLSSLFQDARLFSGGSARSHRAHDAFCGSLCAHNIKCRIEVTYLALSDVSTLRSSVTAAVKYAENRLRACLSVKSRLSVPPLALRYREEIDRYFARLSDHLHPKDPPPAYEKLYDAPSHGTDFSAASRIEQTSWTTTRLLVSEEEEPTQPLRNMPFAHVEQVNHPLSEEQLLISDSIEETKPMPSAQDCTGIYGLDATELEYLRLLLAGERGRIRALLAAEGRLEDELMERINEKTVVGYGDIVLESAEDGYRIIADYEEEVSAWIGTQK